MTHKNYLFDIDGTLTPPRLTIEPEFEEFFFNWMQGKSVYLVTGSDMKKVKEQLSERIISSCSGIFCSMANELYINDSIIYKNELDLPIQLINYLQNKIKLTNYPDICHEHFEFRTGMLNYSIIGRDCTQQQRLHYYEWDKQNKEREEIASYINDNFDNVEAAVGGQISIDIQNKGNNKSLASKWIRKNIGGLIYFFGDRTFKGGNDYDICIDIEEHNDGKFFQINEQEMLKGILNSI
jgi:phosphomannomutase